MRALKGDTKRKRMGQLVSQNGWRCHYCHIALVPEGYEDRHCTPWITDTHQVGTDRKLSNGRGDFALPLHLGQPSIDHIIPQAEGGTHDLHNLVLCCLECNLSKKTRSYETFYTLTAPMRAARAESLE